MNIEQVRDFVLSLEGVEESCPFGPSVVVYKTNAKIFLLLPLDTEDLQCNVKCDPEEAIQQRLAYPNCILPGYHMNKKHWNTLIIDGRLSDSQVKQFITDSYHLIKIKNTRKRSTID